MVLIDSYVSLAQIVEQKLTDNKTALGLKGIFYGDQRRIPYTPAACVEPMGKNRELQGLPRRTAVVLSCGIIVYLYNLGSPEDVRLADDEMAESIETILHQDPQLVDSNGDQQVIDSMVTSIESGYQQNGNSLFRAARLTFEAHSIVQLPTA